MSNSPKLNPHASPEASTLSQHVQISDLLQEGLALHRVGKLSEARAIYEEILQIQTDYFEALQLLGTLEAQSKNFTQAATYLTQAIQLNRHHGTCHSNLGNALIELGRHDEALASHNRAIEICITTNSGNLAICHNNRGNALLEMGRLEEALESFNSASISNPDYAEVYSNRGNVFKKMGRLEDALASYDKAINLNNRLTDALSNRGVTLQALGRFEEALADHNSAIEINADFAQAYSNRGNTLQALGRLDEAIDSHSKAIKINSNSIDAYWNISLCYLLGGNLLAGWQGYEWRWKIPQLSASKHYRNFPQPLWLGNYPLQGKTILLHAEQGLGDTLQFCRYVPLVAQLGAKVILEVQAPLIGLLKDLSGISTLVARGDALPAFDYQCPLMSLPLAFQTTLESIPATVPYLSANPNKVCLWQDRLGPKTKPRVGLVWNGGHRQEQPELWNVNQRRNLPLEQIARLQSLDMEFYSLQKGNPAESELKAKQASVWPSIINYANDLKDFTDTAALMQCMDLIISVDTSCAHLAGALGKPVWILNRFDSCWRWLLEREDSPWYPTAKLYRQKTPGDWDGVIERVARDLGVANLKASLNMNRTLPAYD